MVVESSHDVAIGPLAIALPIPLVVSSRQSDTSGEEGHKLGHKYGSSVNSLRNRTDARRRGALLSMRDAIPGAIPNRKDALPNRRGEKREHRNSISSIQEKLTITRDPPPLQ